MFRLSGKDKGGEKIEVDVPWTFSREKEKEVVAITK